MAQIDLDLMEYATDAAAQAAYVTNGVGSNILTGGTPSADTVYGAGYEADKAVDGNTGTYWSSTVTAFPHWWKYDLGAGVTKVVQKLRLYPYFSAQVWVKDFSVQGSNNDSTWDTLYTGQTANISGWQEFSFNNLTAYRYYRVYITSSWYGTAQCCVPEIEMNEISPQVYSEPTIKVQGSYSLKGLAQQTISLNKTLIRSVSPTINLTDKTVIWFYMYASRTGSNIKIGIHDSGGTTTEITPNILAANTWQLVVLDLSQVANANKDAIDQIIITILNADANNTFYIDNMFGDVITNYLIHRGRDRFRTAGYSLG